MNCNVDKDSRATRQKGLMLAIDSQGTIGKNINRFQEDDDPGIGKCTYTAGLSTKIMGYSWILISSKKTFFLTQVLSLFLFSNFSIERRGFLRWAVMVIASLSVLS